MLSIIFLKMWMIIFACFSLNKELLFDELRYILQFNFLFVVYVIRLNDVHRIISARKATKKEKSIYEEKNNQ